MTDHRPNEAQSTTKPLWPVILLPGLHVKRWLLVLLLGVTIAGLGFAFLIREMYVAQAFPPIVYVMALTSLPDWMRGSLLLFLGFTFIVIAVWFMNRSIIHTLVPSARTQKDREIVSTLLHRQIRRHGPRVVAIGGGTGMPQLLRGISQYTDDITAIVTVADDGGSSGRLRRQMGLLPPGDFRNNIAALSEAEDLMTRLFQYRFAQQELIDDSNLISPLAGHSFGNLFIAAMASVTGSFESGIAESSRVLAVRGKVLPSTLEQLTLCADVSYVNDDGQEHWEVVEGESHITSHRGKIERVYLKPENARAYPAAVQAILQAELIVAGPGSFYTSVLPNLLVPAIRDAICASSAPRIYVCNVATQPGETDGYTVCDHMRQLRVHTGTAFQTVLANNNLKSQKHAIEWVQPPEAQEALDFVYFEGDLIDEERPWRHDSAKLAQRLMEVFGALSTQAETATRSNGPIVALQRMLTRNAAPRNIH